MVARARAFDESYEDYRINLKEEKKHKENTLKGKYIFLNGKKLKDPFPVHMLRRHTL